MFGKSIWLLKCHAASARCEDLILLHFYLHMLNDVNVKNSMRQFKMQISAQIPKTRQKNVATN